MEGDYRQGATQEEAFAEAFALAAMAEDLGVDSIWLAERSGISPLGAGR
jgi:alkanesulfonate monooxygenase SsuD/methylene tetrahydromethanopterin reductase-like flavin-dependent oxidoreductase (luciferase family)